MDDIVDYSRKLKEETSKQKKVYIIICLVVAFLMFSIGFYASYVFNNSSKENEELNKLEEIYSVLKNEWYYGLNDKNLEETLINNGINGMLDLEEDPFTRYYTSLDTASDTSRGLGISVMEYKEYFVITEVASKVNAEAGLKKGDILKSIDGVDLANKESSDIRELIQNKESVSMGVSRGGVDLSLTGYITTYSPVTVFKDFSSEEMAYIQITQFAIDTAIYFENYLQEAKSQGYNKLIIDLRDNPGGYITSVVDCADLLLGKGKVVLTTKNKNGDSYSYKTSNKDKFEFQKIIILINNNSASGAEAFPAALNENLGDVVDLVGITTYGKGSAQRDMYFTDGTYFHYTYALWFTPNGNSIQGVGVVPEIEYVGEGLHLQTFAKVVLKRNDYGEYVLYLQNVLKYLGYYEGDLNSFFSEELETALKQYQLDNGITVTGETNRETIGYISAKYYEDQIKDYQDEVNKIIQDYGD